MRYDENLINEYLPRLSELQPIARRAYGAKDQATPAHDASREYTRLLCEYSARGGSLTEMARKLGVAYSGIRRRVHTADLPTIRRARLPRGSVTAYMVDSAVERLQEARALGTAEYHAQLHAEFLTGIPMNVLARRLGISNAAPLYYGVQSHERRLQMS